MTTYCAESVHHPVSSLRDAAQIYENTSLEFLKYESTIFSIIKILTDIRKLRYCTFNRKKEEHTYLAAYIYFKKLARFLENLAVQNFRMFYNSLPLYCSISTLIGMHIGVCLDSFHLLLLPCSHVVEVQNCIIF